MNYIKRHMMGVQISSGKIVIKKTGLKEELNRLCLQFGSTLEGRIHSARMLLKITQSPPIYVNSNCVLFSTKGMRNMDTVYVNAIEVLYIKPSKTSSTIVFYDQSSLKVDVSSTILRKRYSQAKTLQNYLNL